MVNFFLYQFFFFLLRSFPQLRATFEEYTKAANKDIEDSIKEEMSGDLKKAMITIGKLFPKLLSIKIGQVVIEN